MVDESILKTLDYNGYNQDRILSFDMNPNYIGLTICDWIDDNKDIVYKEIIDLRKINNKDVNNNKRKYEIFQISKHIINLCKHYKCECIGFEKLNIRSKDYKKGKVYNRLCNNVWLRNDFINNIKKRCNIEGIKFYEVYAYYSSFIGQLTNENEYDMIGASLELSRRTNLFKNKTSKDIIYPILDINKLSTRWKEMINLHKINVVNWKELYNYFIKKLKYSYRFLFQSDNKFDWNSLRLNSVKSGVIIYNIIT